MVCIEKRPYSLYGRLATLHFRYLTCLLDRGHIIPTRIHLAVFLFFLHLRLKYKRGNKAKYKRRRYSNCAGSKSACEQSKKSLLIYSLLHALPQYISKTCKWNCCACPCEFSKRLIYSNRSKHNSCRYKNNHYSSRHKLCLFHKNLCKNAYYSSADKCFNKIHGFL